MEAKGCALTIKRACTLARSMWRRDACREAYGLSLSASRSAYGASRYADRHRPGGSSLHYYEAGKSGWTEELSAYH